MISVSALADSLVFLLVFSTSFGLLTALERWYVKRTVMRKALKFTGATPKGAGSKMVMPEKSVDIARNLGALAVPQKKEELDAAREKLMHAGYLHPEAVTIFYGIRLGTGLAFTAASLFWALVTGSFSSRSALLLLIPFALGYFLPALVLKRKIRYRQKCIFRELPDTLDLLAVCLKAGLGFDVSLYRVCRELSSLAPVLSNEFGLYFLEIKGGLPRETALKNLEQRNPSKSLRNVVTVLLQSARAGTDMATALKVYTDAMRTERRQKAEEQAGQLAAKMTLPLVAFILPALVIVVLGPSIINFVILIKEGF